MSFDLSDYVDVASREQALFERYPDARIQTELEDLRNAAGELIGWKCKATIWRTPDDPLPVIDYAVEPVPGKTPYTRDSEAMNASTSAIGRAIVLAGFPSKHIASADEVKARQGNGDGTDDLAQAAKDASVPSEFPIHFGKNRGTVLGDLTPQQLSWYASKWMLQEEPSEYDHRLKAAAVALTLGDNSPIEADPYPEVPFG